MKIINTLLASAVLIVGLIASPAFGHDVMHSTPGIGGYDPVAYFTKGTAQRGSGYHVTDYEGVT